MNKIFITLCLFLAGTAWWYQRKAEQNYTALLNEQAAHGKVVREQDQIWSRLLIQSRQIVALQQDSAYSDLKIRELLDVVKRKNGQIKSLVAFQATWRPDTVLVPGKQDTVIVGVQSRERVTFAAEIQGDTVSGYTLTNPPEASLRLKKSPVAFAVALVEQKSGAYETVITTDNPFLEIAAATGQVIPYAKSGVLSGFFKGGAISIGWTHERAVNFTAEASLWKITPYLEFNEHGLDYGGRIELWRWRR